MKQKKALVLGTNAGQADLIRYLKSKKWEVHSCGFKRIGPGCDIADKFHLVDIVDIASVVSLARMIHADIVYSVSSDVAIKTATKVSEELKLPHFLNSEIIELFDHKEFLRAYLNERNLSTVRYVTVNCIEEIEQWNIFPCVVKPVDSQGQRGVVLIESPEKLEQAVKNALSISKSSKAIVEEYLEGVEFSTHVLLQNGKILVNEFTERYIHGKEFFGLPKGHGIPVRHIGPEILREAKSMIEIFVNSLHVQNALLYIQMVATSNGPKIIEVAPRLDGCHIWRMIDISKGYNLIDYAIKGLLGEKIQHNNTDGKNCSLYFLQQPSGTKFHREGLVVPANTKYLEFRYNEGENIVEINGRLEVVGYYVVED